MIEFCIQYIQCISTLEFLNANQQKKLSTTQLKIKCFLKSDFRNKTTFQKIQSTQMTTIKIESMIILSMRTTGLESIHSTIFTAEEKVGKFKANQLVIRFQIWTAKEQWKKIWEIISKLPCQIGQRVESKSNPLSSNFFLTGRRSNNTRRIKKIILIGTNLFHRVGIPHWGKWSTSVTLLADLTENWPEWSKYQTHLSLWEPTDTEHMTSRSY